MCHRSCRGCCRRGRGFRSRGCHGRCGRLPFTAGRVEYWRSAPCMQFPAVPSIKSLHRPKSPVSGTCQYSGRLHSHHHRPPGFPPPPPTRFGPPPPNFLPPPPFTPIPPPGFNSLPPSRPGSISGSSWAGLPPPPLIPPSGFRQLVASYLGPPPNPIPPPPQCNRRCPPWYPKTRRSYITKSRNTWNINTGGHSLRSPLLSLPGEIRNRIFTLCIDAVRFCDKCQVTHSLVCHTISGLTISGISALALLFVNKQTYNEVIGLVFSHLEPLNITGYYLRSEKRVADEFRQMKHIPKWPKNAGVQRFAGSVNIALTYGRRLNREWRFDGKWYYLTLNTPEHIAVYDPQWNIIPHLVSYLETYKALKEVSLAIEVYQKVVGKITDLEDADLDRLLPFTKLMERGISLKIRLVTGYWWNFEESEHEEAFHDKLLFGWREQLSGWLLKSGIDGLVKIETVG